MYEQIAANKRKTAILFVLAIVLLGGVGYALGVLTNSGPTGLVIALVVAVAMSVGSYLYGDRIVLASTRAKEVTKEEAPRLHNIVEGLAIAAGDPEAARVDRARERAERVRDRVATPSTVTSRSRRACSTR